jgi:hypothetical protein
VYIIPMWLALTLSNKLNPLALEMDI